MQEVAIKIEAETDAEFHEVAIKIEAQEVAIKTEAEIDAEFFEAVIKFEEDNISWIMGYEFEEEIEAKSDPKAKSDAKAKSVAKAESVALARARYDAAVEAKAREIFEYFRAEAEAKVEAKAKAKAKAKAETEAETEAEAEAGVEADTKAEAKANTEARTANRVSRAIKVLKKPYSNLKTAISGVCEIAAEIGSPFFKSDITRAIGTMEDLIRSLSATQYDMFPTHDIEPKHKRCIKLLKNMIKSLSSRTVDAVYFSNKIYELSHEMCYCMKYW